MKSVKRTFCGHVKVVDFFAIEIYYINILKYWGHFFIKGNIIRKWVHSEKLKTLEVISKCETESVDIF